MKRFELHRDHDVSGVSGTGIVAEGVEFTDGASVIRWYGDHPSTVVWASVDAAMAIHGHNGSTRLVWLDDADGPPLRRWDERWDSTSRGRD